MSHSWLQKKRKADLIDLAQKAKLADADGLLKDDLVLMLGDHLNSNETTYAKHPEFREYYGLTSPMKRERVSPSHTYAVTRTTRRRTLIEEALPAEEPTQRTVLTPTQRTVPTPTQRTVPTPTQRTVPTPTQRTVPTPTMPTPETIKAVARTPRAVSRRVSEILNEVDIPASPAQLAEVADQSFQVVKERATELWDRTQIDELKELVRENASSVATIQTIILLVEAVGLQWNTLDTTALFAVPTVLSSYSQSQDVRGPNGWALLTAEWWAPATLWSLTSWVLPLVFAYFFNLTLRSNTSRKSSERQYPADPLIFNIARAVLAYSAYRGTVNTVLAPGRWGPFSEYAVACVGNHVPGGYYGLQIGSLVGILVSLYDAALKK